MKLQRKEQYKKASPKFTVCFMDLANFLGIKLDPEIVEEEAPSNENHNSSFNNIERQQPSIIKEEEEVEGDSNNERSTGKIAQSPRMHNTATNRSPSPLAELKRKSVNVLNHAERSSVQLKKLPIESAKHLRMNSESRNKTPGAIRGKEENPKSNRSIVSYSDISQQFNLQFNNNSEREQMSHRSISINNYGLTNKSI